MKPYARILSAMRATAQNSLDRSALPAGVFTGLLATLMMASSAVHADDMDVYTRDVERSSATPTMAMIFDTSDAAGKNLLSSSGETATTVLHQSLANMKDALRAMITSGPDNLKISLTDYFRGSDGYDNGRILQEMVRVGDVAESTDTSPTFTGKVDTRIAAGSDDAAQGTTASVRTNEIGIDIPNKSVPGYTADINDIWTSSAGAGLQGTCCDGTEDPVVVGSTTYQTVAKAGTGNRFYYYVPSAPDQTFSLSVADSQATNPVLFLVDGANPDTIIAKNDDRGTTLGCPAGYSPGTGTNAGMCKNGSSIVPQIIIDQNSRIIVSGLTVGHEYMLIAATRQPGKADSFTLAMSTPGNGKFHDESTTTVVTASAQNTGFRFQNLDIPQGATISSAKLVFTAVASAGLPPAVQVGLDSNTSPPNFSVQDINSRIDTANYKFSELMATSGNPTVDVTSLVSDQVAKAGWCPGNAMAFVIRPVGSSPDYVKVQSFEGGATDAAQLVVEYDPASGDTANCSQKTINLKIASMSEDTNQFASGVLDIDKAYMPTTSSDAKIADERGTLWISSDTLVGLRFSLARIPRGARITSAKLYLTATGGASQSVTVYSIMTGGTAQAFVPHLMHLTPLVSANTVSLTWKPGSWTAGTKYEVKSESGKDVTELVAAQVAQEGWMNGGTLGFVLKGQEMASMKACAWESLPLPGGGFASIDEGDFGSCAASLDVTFNLNGAADEKTYREVLVEKMLGLQVGGPGQPMGAAYLKTAEYLGGYFTAMNADKVDDGTCDITPVAPKLAGGACSSNTIVFIAENNEGATYNKDAYVADVKSFVDAVAPGSDSTCTVSGPVDNMNGKNCTVAVATALFDNGDGGFTQVSDASTKYSVKTFPINFGATAGGAGGGGDTSGGGTMRAIASSGGGEFYQSGSSGELVMQLLNIVKSVADQGAAVAAPGISVNALNRFEHLDQLYYSLFKPSTQVDWTGNLKRYQLLNSQVADVQNEPAVVANASGFFSTDAESWWSSVIDEVTGEGISVVDGAVVTNGGAASESITDERRIFTYLGKNSDVSATTLTERVKVDNVNISADVLGIDALNMPPEYFGVEGPLFNQEQRDQRALQVLDFLTAAPNNQRFWAAAIHASPRIVAFNSNPDPTLTVFYGDNRGFLHAVNAGGLTSSDPLVNRKNTGGKELFAFLPQELLKNAGKLEDNTQSVLDGGYVYGMDGDMTLIRKDVDFDGDYDSDDDKVYLFAGMRRGGKNYYGLDVSKARINAAEADRTPILQFVIEGGTTPYEELGQTWSAMSVNNIKFDGEKQQVLVFAGGYDAVTHDIDKKDEFGTSTTDGKAFRDVEQLGRYVYMVDAQSGGLLWSSKMMDVSKFPALAYMKYSMTATPRLYDRNADGMVDGMYVVDLAGQVFRFEFRLDNKGAENLVSSVVLVATLGAAASGADPVLDNRRFYDSPSVAFVRNTDGTADVLLALSSGYREEPYDKTTNEMFIFLRDKGAFDSVSPPEPKTLTLADLENVSEKASATNPIGWYFSYDQDIGEKGVGSPVIFNNAILFSSYVLESAPSSCVPDIGSTRLYLTDFYGLGLLEGNNRWQDIGLPGMADTPQVIFREGGGLDLAVGVRILDAAGLCDGSVACPFDSSLFGKLQRGRWYIQDEE